MSAYDQFAEWYDGWVTDPVDQDSLYQSVETLLGEAAGQRICDLACGQGRVARRLAEQGARVIGVDRSAKMLEIARRREHDAPTGVVYLRDDAQHLGSIADHAFNGVVCHMALMDIPNLAPTIYTIARILHPGGWFVGSFLHPCYNTAHSTEDIAQERPVRIVGGYFIEGFWRSDFKPGVRSRVGSYHRTLSTYLNTLIDAGLMMEHMVELKTTGDFAAARPVWAEVPAALAIRCRKLPEPGATPLVSQQDIA